jgi:putative ABC transport system permease protein
VETLLALGATRWEAARQPVQQAIRTGMLPLINSMMVVGIVSLPAMMTGQLLAGVAPLQAVKYQIVIMFLIASGTALGTVGVVLLSYWRLFDSDHQFLYHRIKVQEQVIDLVRSPLAK